jgi:hypothetical protein
MHDNVAAERRDVALHPAQCSALIGLPVIAVGRAIECRMGHESERAEAVDIRFGTPKAVPDRGA